MPDEIKAQEERGGVPSASSSERVVRCPGSVPLVDAVLRRKAAEGVQKPNPSGGSNNITPAEEGTKIHAALEEDNFSELNMTQAEIAERLSDLEATAKAKWLSDIGYEKERVVIREMRFWIRDEETLDPVFSAKPDVIYVAGSSALILNYKTGYKPTQSAARNWQSRTEALCFWRDFDDVITNVRVGIVQYRFKEIESYCDYDEANLEHALADLYQSLWRTRQPDAPRYASYWCLYCPAKADCREAAAYAMLPSLMGDVAGMTHEDLAFIERRRLITEKILDAVTARLKGLAADDLAKIGFELKTIGDKREIFDVAGTYLAIVEDKALLEPEEFWALCSLPLGKLQEAVLPKLKEIGAGEAGGTKKAALMEALMAIIKPFVRFTPSSPRLKDLL